MLKKCSYWRGGKVRDEPAHRPRYIQTEVWDRSGGCTWSEYLSILADAGYSAHPGWFSTTIGIDPKPPGPFADFFAVDLRTNDFIET